MTQNIKVPKFGELDGGESYTDVFDKARNKRSGVKTNPKNPQHHSMYSDNVSSGQATPFQMETKLGAQKGQQPVWTKHTRGTSREDGHLRKSSDSPQCHDTANPKVSCDSTRRHRGSINSSDSSKRGVKQNVGSDHRIELSLLHQHQSKVGVKGNTVSSHLWERKGSTERGNNLAPFTPGRSRLRSVTQDSETPDHGAAIPKFGDWDESDPKSADGFTHVFDKVREEKLNGTPNVAPVKAFQDPYGKGLKQCDSEMSKKCCCFPW